MNDNRGKITLVFIYLCFFLSGGAGLIYEVLWSRYLTLLIGGSTRAQVLVLTVFMGGLALGNFLLGRRADKSRNVLMMYVIIEALVGVYALIWPPFFDIIRATFFDYAPGLYDSPKLMWLVKLALASGSILLPTFLMGGTLPILARALIDRTNIVAGRIGMLYFINSAGGVIGSLLGGYVLINHFGLDTSIRIAGTVNIVVAISIPIWLKLAPLFVRPKLNDPDKLAPPPPLAEPEAPFAANIVKGAILVATLSGFVAMVYEVAWIRLLTLVMGASVYSFSLMLAAFILGIALGSLIFSVYLKRDPLGSLGYSQIGIAAAILLTLPLYERLPYFFVKLAGTFRPSDSTYMLHQMLVFGISLGVMILPTTMMGISLPAAARISTPGPESTGRRVGLVFAVNTLGTLLGSALAGIFIIPSIGLRATILGGVLINILLGATVLYTGRIGKRGMSASLVGIALFLWLIHLVLMPAWNRNILVAGEFRNRKGGVGDTYEDYAKTFDDEVLYYKDGVNATIALLESGGMYRYLKVNGKTDASSHGDLSTQMLLGHLPMFLNLNAKNVCVIGFGSGITSASVLKHPVDRVDLVELSPEVLEAGQFFSEHNDKVLDNPKFHPHIEDGKFYLSTTPRKFDVVISEPSNPWMAGIGGLYTLEFFRAAREHLNPGGIMVQWFHLYEMDNRLTRMVLKTFVDAFPYTTLWMISHSDIMLVGAAEPYSPDYQRIRARFAEQQIADDLDRIKTKSAAAIFSLQTAGSQRAKDISAEGEFNLDRFPRLEYGAPKAFFLDKYSTLLDNEDERLLPPHESELFFNDYRRLFPFNENDYYSIYLYDSDSGGYSEEYILSLLLAWRNDYPQDTLAPYFQARWLADNGENYAAANLLAKYEEQSASDHVYCELQAEILQIIADGERSILYQPDNGKLIEVLYRCLDLQEDTDKRVETLQKIGEAYSDSGQYSAALSAFLEELGIFDQSSKSEDARLKLMRKIGDMFLQLGDTQEAVKYFRKIIDLDPLDKYASNRHDQILRSYPLAVTEP